VSIAGFRTAGREIAGIGRRKVRGLVGGTPGRGGVVIVLDGDGRVLLVRAVYRRSWTPPGGFVADDEDPLDGALRELREETTLQATGRLVDRIERHGHVEHVVVADTVSGRPEPASWEIRSVVWHAPTDHRVLHRVALEALSRATTVVGDRYVLRRPSP
jgi:ADP-ribose pyrophosphatase YjhB (NUDIX family)